MNEKAESNVVNCSIKSRKRFSELDTVRWLPPRALASFGDLTTLWTFNGAEELLAGNRRCTAGAEH
jgi:hypothetical protein